MLITHDSFSTTGTCCHNSAISQAASHTICTHGCFYAVLPSSRIFKGVAKLAVAPTCRRPSTNRIYDYRLLCFTNLATGRGFDPLGPTSAQLATFLYEFFDTHGVSLQTIKGYRSCLASVLSRTGRAAEVQAKTISDMIMSMELQRPRLTPVLPQWDLGIVLEALSKPPYEPLREAFLKHLTLKTVFLLAMASGGRRSELQALVFDPQYIQFKP